MQQVYSLARSVYYAYRLACQLSPPNPRVSCRTDECCLSSAIARRSCEIANIRNGASMSKDASLKVNSISHGSLILPMRTVDSYLFGECRLRVAMR